MEIDINSEPPGEGIDILINYVLLVVDSKKWSNEDDKGGFELYL